MVASSGLAIEADICIFSGNFVNVTLGIKCGALSIWFALYVCIL